MSISRSDDASRVPSEALPRTAEVMAGQERGLCHAAGHGQAVTAKDLRDGHVVLDLECLNRIYLNAYVRNRRSAGRSSPF
jgi:hypothetical protein